METQRHNMLDRRHRSMLLGERAAGENLRNAVATPGVPGHGRTPSRTFALTSFVNLALCFYPYAAVPLGQSSNLPLACLSSIAVLALAHLDRRISAWAFAIAFTPVVAAFLGALWPSQAPAPGLKGLLPLALYVLPMVSVGVASASLGPGILARQFQAVLLASSCAAIVQYFLVLRGRVIFFGIHSLAGYADLTGQSDTVLRYEHRAFGWFPEPSFLAGTISLGCLAMLVLARRASPSLSPVTTLVAVVCCVTIFLSGSGTSLASIPAIVLLLVSGHTGLRRAILSAPLFVAGGVALQSILATRTPGTDSSWHARAASILPIMHLQMESIRSVLVGLGPNAAEYYYRWHLVFVPATGFNFPAPVGMNSVFLRMIVEDGYPVGGLLLVALTWAMWRALRVSFDRLQAAAVVATWVFIGSLVIAYNSALLIWILPGVILAVPDRLRNATKGQSGGHRRAQDRLAQAAA